MFCADRDCDCNIRKGDQENSVNRLTFRKYHKEVRRHLRFFLLLLFGWLGFALFCFCFFVRENGSMDLNSVQGNVPVAGCAGVLRE